MATTNKPQIIEHISKSVAYTPYDTLFVPSSARVAVIGAYPRGTGIIHVMQLNNGKVETVVEKEKKAPFKCATFAHNGPADRLLAVGSFEGEMSVWNLERMETPVYYAKRHNSIVNCIDGVAGRAGSGGGAPELVTGSRDGFVHVWDMRQKDEPVASFGPDDAKDARDCWAVAFGNSFDDEERCVAAGYDNGDVKLFDLRTMSQRWETNVKNGVVSIEFDRPDIAMNKLVVTMLESKFNVYDLRTENPKEGFAFSTQKAHKSTVWFGRHLPQNRDIWMTGGGNGSLNLWKYKYPSQRDVIDPVTKEKKGVMGEIDLLNSVTFSTQPIHCFHWCAEKEGLCTFAAFDQIVRIGIVTRLKSQ